MKYFSSKFSPLLYAFFHMLNIYIIKKSYFLLLAFLLTKVVNYITGDTGVTSRGFLHFTPTPQPSNSQQNNFNLASIGPRNSQRHSLNQVSPAPSQSQRHILNQVSPAPSQPQRHNLNQVSPAPSQSQRHIVPSGAKLFDIPSFAFAQSHEM